MATIEKTLSLILDVNDRASLALRSVSDELNGFSKGADQIKNILSPVADVTAGLLKIEGAVLATGAAMTLFAVKTAGDFDAAFREIATLIDVPAESLGGFRQDILDYANGSTQSIEQITQSIYGAISAGTDFTHSIDMVRQAEQLAVASKANMSDTLVLLVSSLNAYGKGAEDAEHFSDLLFTTVKQGQTTMPELASSLAQVTGLAAGAGVPFETLLSAVASLTASGLPTSQAITAIKASLSAIIKPSSQAAEEAERLGIKFNASALQSKGLEGVLLDVARATGGNVEEMGKLFGSTEALNAVIALSGMGAEKFAAILLAMKESAGATEIAFKKMADTIGQGQQQIENALKVLLISIGTPLLDEFGGIQKAIAAIFTAIGKSVDQGNLGEFVKQIEGMAKEAEAALQSIAKNLPKALESADFSGFLGGIQTVKDAFLGLFDGADLTTAEGLKQVIETVGKGFMALSTFVGGTIDAIGPFFELLKEVGGFIASLDPEIVKIGGAIGGIALAAVPTLSALSSLAQIFSLVSGSAGGLLSVIAGQAGLAAVIGGATVTSVGLAVKGFLDMREAQAEASDAADRASASAKSLADKYAEISKQTGVTIESTEDFHRLINEGVIVADKEAGVWRNATDVKKDWLAEVEKASSGLKDWTKELAGSLDKQENLITALGSSTKGIKDNKEEAINAAAAYYELAGNTPEVARRMAELVADEKAPLPKTTTALGEAGKKAETFNLAWQKILSAERMKAMQLNVDFKMAKLQADTEQFKALMEGMNKSVESTGKTLEGFAGQIDSVFRGGSSKAKELLTTMIKEESKRRDKLIESQTGYLDLLSERLKIQNERLQSGEALIKISSDGLEPALEMIMWQVMEKVQIRAAEEEAEFLIGLNTAQLPGTGE